jgi:phosphatidate cytidylyltransferase
MDSVNAVSEPFRKLLASNLFQRIGSALVLLPIIALITWWGEPLVSSVVMLLALLALHELYDLFQAGGFIPRRWVGYFSVLLFVLAAPLEVRTEFDWPAAALSAAILVSLGSEVARRDRQQQLLNWALTLSGALYIGWTLAHVVLLRAIDHHLESRLLTLLQFDAGAVWIVVVLAITFVSDTGAYFVGRRLGRHQMASYVSPKKSWEGAVSGLSAAILTSMVLVALFGLPGGLWGGALLGGAGSIAGQIGDLVESLIKRQIGIKDSGHLIPGHGGLLDRIDSLLFTAPVLYYLILLLI